MSAPPITFVEGQGLQSDYAAVRRVSCAYTKVSNARLKVLRDAVQCVMAITDARNRFWQGGCVSGIAAKDRFVHALRTLK
jgi:hypothetical protein